MINKIDESINQALNILCSNGGMMHVIELFKEDYTFSRELQSLDRIMIDKALIYSENENRLLTDFGATVCKSGGWLEHLNELERTEKLERGRQLKADEKLSYELRISKYLFKTRWWPLIISLFSLGVAIWALFKK